MQRRITEGELIKWVQVLRSNRYKKGYGYLHSPRTNSYCCLGVLCKILDIDSEHEQFIMRNGEYILLSKEVQLELAALNDSQYPSYFATRPNASYNGLIQTVRKWPASFKPIATVIKQFVADNIIEYE